MSWPLVLTEYRVDDTITLQETSQLRGSYNLFTLNNFQTQLTDSRVIRLEIMPREGVCGLRSGWTESDHVMKTPFALVFVRPTT